MDKKEDMDKLREAFQGLWGNPQDLDPETKKILQYRRYRKHLAELKERIKNLDR